MHSTKFVLLSASVLAVTYAAPLPLRTSAMMFMNQEPMGYGKLESEMETHLQRPHHDQHPSHPQHNNLDCEFMSIDTLTSLPGWDKIKMTAENRWGIQSEYIVETRGRGTARDLKQAARICVSPHVTHLSVHGTPSCSSSMQSSTTAPLAKGILGVMTTQQVGKEVDARVSVAGNSRLSIEGANIGVPDMHGFTEFMQGTIQNSLVHKSNVHEEAIFVNGKPEQHCTVKSYITTCTASSSGKMRLLASGTLWFNVNGRRHHLNIEDVLAISERSTYLEINADIVSQRRGKAPAVCA